MFNETIRYLPFSARRYSVSQYGKIFHLDQEIRQYEKDGQLYIDLEWVLGKRAYLVALVVLVGFEKVRLPEYLFDEIEPLFHDGNVFNIAPVNLLYRFRNGPLPVEGRSGYFYIPFYTDYAISENGSIFNIVTGKEKVWSITKSGGLKNQTGGYYYNRVISDDGAISRTLFLHRALCLVFKRYENDVFEKVVNHKDGFPGNNKLDNLEWVTYLENNVHAYDNGLRPGSTSPVLMKDLKTNVVLRFESTAACARHLNNPSGSFIRYRLDRCPRKVFADMLMFKYDDGSLWPEINTDEINICRFGNASDIVARNVFTGELIIFQGTTEGAALTNVKSATILRHVRECALIPVNGWNFRYKEFSNDWPRHTERHLKIYEAHPIYPPDGIIATNISTGAESFYTSSAVAANAFNLGKRALWDAIQRNSVVKDTQFRFFKLRENLSLPME